MCAGFCIELIQKLAEYLQFNYTFVEETSGDYGKRNNVTGEWSGMLGRLMTDPVRPTHTHARALYTHLGAWCVCNAILLQEISFAITDLTITEEREQAVDFTTPFMNLGISILYRTPDKPEPETFAFLHPFSTDVRPASLTASTKSKLPISKERSIILIDCLERRLTSTSSLHFREIVTYSTESLDPPIRYAYQLCARVNPKNPLSG